MQRNGFKIEKLNPGVDRFQSRPVLLKFARLAFSRGSGKVFSGHIAN